MCFRGCLVDMDEQFLQNRRSHKRGRHNRVPVHNHGRGYSGHCSVAPAFGGGACRSTGNRTADDIYAGRQRYQDLYLSQQNNKLVQIAAMECGQVHFDSLMLSAQNDPEIAAAAINCGQIRLDDLMLGQQKRVKPLLRHGCHSHRPQWRGECHDPCARGPFVRRRRRSSSSTSSSDSW